MSIKREFNNSMPQGESTLSPRVQWVGRKLFRLPFLRKLKPYARKAYAVTEPPADVTFQSIPANFQERSCSTITVMSANLWHDWPLYRRLPERLNAFAYMAEEEDVDILLLQEVARTPDMQADEWLANQLGMSHVYSRANGHEAIGFEEGLALLSRFPMTDPQLKQLGVSKNPFVRRMALGAKINTPCGLLSAFSVHLGLLPKDNVKQQAHLRQWVNGSASNGSVVVGGDFNAIETSPQIKTAREDWVDTYRHLHPDGDGHTHVLRWPWGGIFRRQRLDYIFLLSQEPRWQVLETRHISTPGESHSDHHAVLTRLVSLN